MTLEVDYNPALRLTALTGATTVSIDGGGPCTTAGTIVDVVDVVDVYQGTLTATATTTAVATGSTSASTFTCGLGAVVGTGHFDLEHPDFPSPSSGTVAIAFEAGVAEVVVHASDNEVTASGVFVQEPADTLACPGGLSEAEWTGRLAFTATRDLQPKIR